MVAPPVSPLAAKQTTPLVVKCESLLASVENSLPPQLIDTSPPPPLATRLLATSTAAKRLAKLLLAASTKMILAPGAMAWAHSMSRAASWAQPQLVRGFVPLAKTFSKQPFAVVQGGRPRVLENTFRSFSAVGKSKA